jgi:hypothetical protein
MAISTKVMERLRRKKTPVSTETLGRGVVNAGKRPDDGKTIVGLRGDTGTVEERKGKVYGADADGNPGWVEVSALVDLSVAPGGGSVDTSAIGAAIDVVSNNLSNLTSSHNTLSNQVSAMAGGGFGNLDGGEPGTVYTISSVDGGGI